MQPPGMDNNTGLRKEIPHKPYLFLIYIFRRLLAMVFGFFSLLRLNRRLSHQTHNRFPILVKMKTPK